MHETEDGEKNPNGLTDFLDFHGLLPTLEHIGRGRTRGREAFPISLPKLEGVSNSIPCLWPR